MSEFDFSVPYSPTGVYLYGSALATSATEKYSPPQWRRLNLPGLPKNVVCTEVRITDMNSGWNQDGDLIAPSTGGAYVTYGRHMLLPPSISQTTLGTAGPDNGCLFHCFFGTERKLVMGGGATDNFQLFTETSATDPTPTAVTVAGTLGAVNVVSLSAGILNSTSERVIVGMDQSTAARYMAADLGSYTAMHANTADLWASGRSNINASTPGRGTNLLYAATSIYTLAENSAIAGAPTQVLTGVPAGGSGMASEQLQKNWPLRYYMWWPLADNGSTSAVQSGNPGQVVSINLEGTDPQPVPTTLSRVYWAALWNRTVVQTDGVRIVSYDGETERDLHFLKNRRSNSDFRWGVMFLAVNGGELYAGVIRFDLTVAAGSLGSTTLVLERYLPENDAWVPVSGGFPLDNVAGDAARETMYGRVDYVISIGPSMPISRQTGHLHLNMRSSTKWDRTWVAPEGVNPFYHYNQTGSNQEVAQSWGTIAGVSTAGTLTTNKFPIPGLTKWPSFTNPPQTPRTVVYEIDGTEMDIAAGGTSATVEVQVADQTGTSFTFPSSGTGVSAIFASADPIHQQVKRFYSNTSAFTKCQLKWTLTRGSSANKTMNALPLTVRFMTFLDGNVVAPSTYLTQVTA